MTRYVARIMLLLFNADRFSICSGIRKYRLESLSFSRPRLVFYRRMLAHERVSLVGTYQMSQPLLLSIDRSSI